MSIRGLKKMALLLTFWVALQGRGLRADQTITGNLTVTGSNVYMGEQISTTNPGWGTIYTDGTNSTVEFQGTRSGNTWEWQQNDGAIVQMTLSTSNTLTLYNQTGTNEITLNPTGTSSFTSSVTISGTNNTMPNQTLTGSSSVLTEGLGDSRYLSSGASSLVIGSGSTASGTNSVSLGFNTAASGNDSFAGGNDSTASGYVSTATGYGTTASGGYSFASGNHSTAIGWSSTALGRSTAIGGSSTAMGYSIASGDWSTASGRYTTAQAYNSFVIGTYNVGGGNETSWVATDPLFEIGNGTTSTNTSDALVVYKNGNVTAQGTITAPAVITTTQTGDIPMFTGY